MLAPCYLQGGEYHLVRPVGVEAALLGAGSESVSEVVECLGMALLSERRALQRIQMVSSERVASTRSQAKSKVRQRLCCHYSLKCRCLRDVCRCLPLSADRGAHLDVSATDVCGRRKRALFGDVVHICAVCEHAKMFCGWFPCLRDVCGYCRLRLC